MDKKFIALKESVNEVFLREGVMSDLRGFTKDKYERLSFRYIENSLGAVEATIKSDKAAQSIDRSKGDITRTSEYLDYSKVHDKLNALAQSYQNNQPKGFKNDFLPILNELNKLDMFLTGEGKALMKSTYTGGSKYSRTGQLLYVGLAMNMFLLAQTLFLSYVEIDDRGSMVIKDKDLNLRNKSKAVKSCIDMNKNVNMDKMNRILNLAHELDGKTLSEDVIDIETGDKIKPEPEPVEKDIDELEDNEVEKDSEEEGLTEEVYLLEDNDSLVDAIQGFFNNGGKANANNKAEGTASLLNKLIPNDKLRLVIKGASVIALTVAMLFAARLIVMWSLNLRISIAKYLRETAEIIDEQIDAVGNEKTRDKQIDASNKLKILAEKFDIDSRTSETKSDRYNRSFDQDLLDEFKKETEEVESDNEFLGF